MIMRKPCRRPGPARPAERYWCGPAGDAPPWRLTARPRHGRLTALATQEPADARNWTHEPADARNRAHETEGPAPSNRAGPSVAAAAGPRVKGGRPYPCQPQQPPH